MTIKLTSLCRLSVVVLVGLFTACAQPGADLTPTAVMPSTEAPKPIVPDPIAKISEIQKLPVFVRLLNATQEEPAKEGMGLHTGETIRTQGQALTQIDLNNGLAFRLAGDAVLKIQPDNRLNLTAGDMITWVQPGKKLPTEIITPTAVAGIRGTTVFVKIPKDPKEGVLFFAWEGAVAVRLTGQTEEVLLKTAEEVRIRPGDRDIRLIRQRVRRMGRAEWRRKRATDPILRSFKKAKMTTLPLIDRLQPGQLALPSSSVSPRPVESIKAAGSQKFLKAERPTAEKPLQADKPSQAEKLSRAEKQPKAEKPPKAEKRSKAEKPAKPDKAPKPSTDRPSVDSAFRKPTPSGKKQADAQDRDDRTPKQRGNKPEGDDRDRSQKPRSKWSDG